LALTVALAFSATAAVYAAEGSLKYNNNDTNVSISNNKDVNRGRITLPNSARAPFFGLFASNLRQPVTKAQFCELSVAVLNDITGYTVSNGICAVCGGECAATLRDSAAGQGGATEQGGAAGQKGAAGQGGALAHAKGEALTREEAAVLLTNLMNIMGMSVSGERQIYADESSISDWAVRHVSHVQAGGIMAGSAENYFYPQGLMTVEQTIKSLLAVYFRTFEPEPERIPVDSPQVKGKSVPILMYHAVDDTPRTSNTGLFVKTGELESHLKYLSENGYQSITFEDFDNIGAFSKPVMLTFDDGYFDNYETLYPLLKKYNMKATIFMIANAVWDKKFCSRENLREMSDSGYVSVQSHTMNHYDLTTLGAGTLAYEMEESKAYIEEITGKPVIAVCYPIGANNAAVRDAAAVHYSYGLTISSGKFSCGSNPYAMPRIYIGRGTGVSTLAGKIR